MSLKPNPEDSTLSMPFPGRAGGNLSRLWARIPLTLMLNGTENRANCNNLAPLQVRSTMFVFFDVFGLFFIAMAYLPECSEDLRELIDGCMQREPIAQLWLPISLGGARSCL